MTDHLRWHDKDDEFWQPRDEKAHPPTIKAADGKTILTRFRVEGVIYAPSQTCAEDSLDQAGLYLTAGALVQQDD